MNPETQRPLNWHGFNFLENLLLFCAHPQLSVPKESGIRFWIDAAVHKHGLCLLYRIDRGNEDSLMPKDKPKPDYLCIYLTQEHCIVTAIELKGQGESDLTHALEQIQNLLKRLKTEVSNHLPRGCCMTYQGLVLTSKLSNFPNQKALQIQKAEGFVIRSRDAQQQSDISTCVMAPLSKLCAAPPQPLITRDKKDRSSSTTKRGHRDLPPLQRLLMSGAAQYTDTHMSLYQRPPEGPQKQDASFDVKRRVGVYLPLADPELKEAVLALPPSKPLQLCVHQKGTFEELKTQLQALNWLQTDVETAGEPSLRFKVGGQEAVLR